MQWKDGKYIAKVGSRDVNVARVDTSHGTWYAVGLSYYSPSPRFSTKQEAIEYVEKFTSEIRPYWSGDKYMINFGCATVQLGRVTERATAIVFIKNMEEQRFATKEEAIEYMESLFRTDTAERKNMPETYWKDGKYIKKIGTQYVVLGSVTRVVVASVFGGKREYFVATSNDKQISGEFDTESKARECVEKLFVEPQELAKTESEIEAMNVEDTFTSAASSGSEQQNQSWSAKPIWIESILYFKTGNHLFRVGSYLEKSFGYFTSYDRRSFENHESVAEAKEHLESSIPNGHPKWDTDGFFRVQDYVLASAKRTHSNKFSAVIFSDETRERQFQTEDAAREFIEKELS